MDVHLSAAEGAPSIEEHLYLVRLIAGRYRGGSLDFDELVQVGVLGMIEAAERFDAGRGFQFSTFAPFWIRREMVNALKQRTAELARNLSLEEPLLGASSDDNDAQCLGDLLVAPDTSAQEEQRQEVARLLKHLSLQERQVIEQRYQIGREAEYGVEDIPLAYTEVGKRLGISAGLVKTTETRALLKMRYWAGRGSLLAASSSGETRAS